MGLTPPSLHAHDHSGSSTTSFKNQRRFHLDSSALSLTLSLLTRSTSLLKMTAGLGACVMLAVLCTSCLGLPFSDEVQHSISALKGTALSVCFRLSRFHICCCACFKLLLRTPRVLAGAHTQPLHGAAERPPWGEERTEIHGQTLSELLARLISTRKGSVRRNSSANNRGGVLRANHRIADRDYLGWMDFGRRSAEEYEYSS
ncbi:hypothetical protein OJAV_G00107550 [Oryzias javanicus]|uniref:Gastrin/cholecystokinin peptide hormone domain-containing protein n=1 Tax=Oryzias javanicus TaxID=123683 RepID=A0A437CU48_ORYJA|nr:hypothetical protein OJAV_G00107550 [Oryzias javanicus]